MSKKNKIKGNNQPATQQNNSSVVRPSPNIVVKPANEILTSEEGAELLQNAEKEAGKRREEADTYYNGRKEEADLYYEERKEEADIYFQQKKKIADGLEEQKQKRIDEEVEKAVKLKEKEAKKITDDAKAEADKMLADLTKRQEDLTKEYASLAENKRSYKQEVCKEIENNISTLTQNNQDLEKEVEGVKKELKRKDARIVALEEDKKVYEEQISKNAVRNADVELYKMQIDDLNYAYENLKKQYKEQQKNVDDLNLQILSFGEAPQKAIKENVLLREQVNELQSRICDCPSLEELEKLRETSSKFEELSNKLELLKNENTKLEIENNDLKVSKDEIESLRKFVKILELQKAELQGEIERNIELYNTSTKKVFANLSAIDLESNTKYEKMSITLKQLCERFRGYLANRRENPLYYDAVTIRTFIAGFACSKIIILEGLSGTGKSSLPRAFQDFIGAQTHEVPVQSSWKDRNDLLGFYNDFKKQYKETKFLKELYRATHDQDNIHIIVLDEMNLSHIEYYFADLLSVLEIPEIEKRKIELISDYASIAQNSTDAWPKHIIEGQLQICENTWFVGTANKDDSTFDITDKVYDRATVIYFDKKGEKEKVDNANPIQMNSDDFLKLLNSASNFKSELDEKKYNDMIKNLDTLIREKFDITFGNRIANQLKVFVPVYIECGGTVEEAVDVVFSRKILRKLEGIYYDETKSRLLDLKEEINEKYKMPISVKTIDRIVATM